MLLLLTVEYARDATVCGAGREERRREEMLVVNLPFRCCVIIFASNYCTKHLDAKIPFPATRDGVLCVWALLGQRERMQGE